jgi:hypothetical protein
MREQQTPRDRVLWILGSGGGEMSISRLRQQMGLTRAGLDIVLGELEREKKIVIRHGSVILKG